MTKYTAYFERYLGRSLYRWERDIIAPIEYLRQHASNHRVVVVDPPGHDSRQLLCDYLRFIHSRIAPYTSAVIMGRTKAGVRRLCHGTTAANSPWLYAASGRQPDSIRGLTFEFALLLDADRYGYDNYCDALSAVAPVVLNESGDCFIIIHTHRPELVVPPAYIRDPQAPRPHPPAHLPAPYVFLLDDTMPPNDGFPVILRVPAIPISHTEECTSR